MPKFTNYTEMGCNVANAAIAAACAMDNAMGGNPMHNGVKVTLFVDWSAPSVLTSREMTTYHTEVLSISVDILAFIFNDTLRDIETIDRKRERERRIIANGDIVMAQFRAAVYIAKELNRCPDDMATVSAVITNY